MTFVREMVNRRRSFFRRNCSDSTTTSIPDSHVDSSCCVKCSDEDLLINAPNFNESTVITNPLHGTLPTPLKFVNGLDKADSKAIEFTGNKQSCIRLGDLQSDAPYGRNCLQYPEKCDYGLSGSVWVNFTEDGFNKEVLMSSINGFSQGFDFYVGAGKLSLTVVGATGRWEASVDNFDKRVGRWRLLGFTWEQATGIIRIYIDSAVWTFHYDSTFKETNAFGQAATSIYAGCQMDGTTSENFLSAVMAHPALWLWPIEEENLILMTGALVYKLIKYQIPTTTSLPTTAPKPQFEYSSIVKELRFSNNQSNPFYELADFYLRPIQLQQNLTSDSNLTLHADTLAGEPRGAADVLRFYFQGSPVAFNYSGLHGQCVADYTQCSEGLSFSFWLKATKPLLSSSLVRFLKINDFSLLLENTSTGLNLQISRAGCTLQNSKINIASHKWVNLGVIYDSTGSSPTIKVYLNGMLERTGTCTSSSSQPDGTIKFGNDGDAAPDGLMLDDIVAWYRPFESYEVHKFMGYTRDQMHHIRYATHYWSSDPSIIGDSLALKGTSHYSFKSMYHVNIAGVIGSSITSEMDRHNKSLATTLSKSWYAHYFLGNDILARPTEDTIMWYSKCLTDPYQRMCQINGLSLHMWIRIGSVDPTKKQFFFSSGDLAEARSSALDSRGISLFTTGHLLGVSLSTDRKDWTIVIDSNRYRVNEWLNLGFTWKESEGMRLFLNGTDYGIRNLHPDISYKAYDKHRRAVIGRFDDDTNSTWKGNSDWVMGNFSFSDVVFYEKWMSPKEFADAIGSVNNRYYVEADLLVWGKEVIDTSYKRMKEARLNSVKIGPSGKVSTHMDSFARIESNGEIGVKAFPVNECPRKLQSCTTSIRLNAWIKVLSKNSSELTILSLGSETDNAEGFGVKIMSDDTVCAWVKKAGQGKAMMTKSTTKVRYNRWFNLGLYISTTYFHPTVYLNGSNVSTAFEYKNMSNTITANSDAGMLKVGKNSSGIASFAVFLVSGWYHKNIISTQVSKVLGIHSNQFSLLSIADEYWTASGLWSDLQPRKMTPYNVELERDKFDLENAAQCTRGSGGSYIDLGDLEDTCLVNTAPCQVFILTFGLKPTMPTTEGHQYIFSTGGQNPGHLGTAISITSDGFLHSVVRSPNETLMTSVPFNYSKWIQLQVHWHKSNTIIIKVDEETISNRAGANNTMKMEVNDNSTFSNGHLGKINSNLTNASKACFSDVMYMYQHVGSSNVLSADIGPSSCYEQETVHVELRGPEANFAGKQNRSSLYNAATSVGVGSDFCLFTTEGCTMGATVSFWLRVDSISGADYVDVFKTAGYPTKQGLQVQVKKATAASKYFVRATGSFLGKKRSVEMSNTEQNQREGVWVNIGVNFLSDMIELYINGIRIAASTTSETAESTEVSSTPNVIFGSPGLAVAVSNLVVWNDPPLNCLNPTKNKKTLTGACDTTTDTLATTCTTTAQASTCKGQIENTMCLDAEFANVKNIDETNMLFSSLAEAKTVSKIIKATVQGKGVSDDFILSSLNIFSRLGANLDVSEDVDNSTIGTFLEDLSDAFSAVMSPRYKNAFHSLVKSGQAKPASLFSSMETLSLKMAQRVTQNCKPVVYTRGNMHFNIQKISNACPNMSVSALGYTSNTRESWNRAQDTFFLPRYLFSGSNPVSVGVVVYNSINDLISSESTNQTTFSNKLNSSVELVVNSRIFSIITSLAKSTTDSLSEPLNMTIELTEPNLFKEGSLKYETRCGFWDTSISSPYGGRWSTVGCEKVHETSTSVKCSCSHATSFGVLMQPVPTPEYNIHAKILSIMTYVLIGISLISLLIFIIVIALNKKMRSERYILHLNLACALFIAQLAFILSNFAKENVHFCKAVAVIMHLFFVATFTLLLVEALWVFYAVTKGIIKGRLKWWLPVAWIIPIVLVAVVGGINGNAYGSKPFCWISGVYIWAFLGPIVGLGAFTLLISGIVICNLNTPAIKRKDILSDLRNHTHQCAFLIPLMVLAWLFGVLLVQWYSIPIEYFFVIFNSPQGFWVFLCFGLLNPDFREAMCCKRSRGSVTSSTASITGVQDIAGSASSFGSKAAIIPGSGDAAKPERKTSVPVYYTGKQQRRRKSSSDEEEPNTSRTQVGESAVSVRSSAAGSQQQLQPPSKRDGAFSPPGAAD